MEQAREILASIEHKTDNGLPLTLVYAALGDVEQAMYWLEAVHEMRMPWYPWVVGWFQSFRPYHDHPLVIAKAQELGVPLLSGPTPLVNPVTLLTPNQSSAVPGSE